MPRPEKVAVVEEIRAKLADADAALLTEYRGLTVGAIAELRGALRPTGTEYKIFKNTLARRAVEAAGRDELLPMLEGPVAIAFVRGDAVVAARALRDFARGNGALVLKGGLLGDRLLVTADLEALADIAPREELLARLAGGFQAPLAKAASLFGVFTRNFAYGLKAYADRRAAAEGSDGSETAADLGDAADGTAAGGAPADGAPADEAPVPEGAVPGGAAPEGAAGDVSVDRTESATDDDQDPKPDTEVPTGTTGEEE